MSCPLPSDVSVESFLETCQVEPRPYQRRIVSRTVGLLTKQASADERPVSSVLIESPTGSGKTVMGLAAATLLQQTTGVRIGWVAMRRNLLTQAAAENAKRGFNADIRWISMFEKNPPDVDLLVIDEAQHDAATSMANLHGQICPRWTIGLSATPYRTDRVKLCFEKVIKDAGIAHLIADGYLSAYHHYTIDQYSPQSVAERLIEEPERWGKSLVFFHKQSDCELLQEQLTNAGIVSTVVTAKTHRERQIEEFRRGRIQVLINMAILTEGFDCPELQTVFCRPSGKGPTIQMAGRVLRKSDSVTTKNVVQCRSTRHPMIRTAIPAEQYLLTAGSWRSIAGNRRLDEMAMVARKRVAQARVELPKLVSMNRNRRTSPWLSRIAS